MAAKKKTRVKVKLNGKGDRFAQLQAVANACNKALGTIGAVYLGKDMRSFERVSTGIEALDYVLGGGLVKGQMIQFTGGESCFKTTAAMLCVARVQKKGGLAVWVAGEGFDRRWAAKHGVNLEKLLIITANMGDTALETAMTLLESNLVDIMVFDSFQSLGTTREMEGAVDDEAYAGAGAPQMWGRVMRRTYAAMGQGCSTCMIGISQVRAAIGKFSGHGVPEPEGTGIWALKHWKCADVNFRKGEMEYEGTADEKRRVLSRQFKLRCSKNKTSVAERQASFTFRRTHDGLWAVDNVGTLMRLAAAYDVIEKKGAWYKGFGIKAQGEEKYEVALKKNPKARKKLRKELYRQLEANS